MNLFPLTYNRHTGLTSPPNPIHISNTITRRRKIALQLGDFVAVKHNSIFGWALSERMSMVSLARRLPTAFRRGSRTRDGASSSSQVFLWFVSFFDKKEMNKKSNKTKERTI